MSLRVLLVEDDSGRRRALERAFAAAGCRVSVAANGAAALLALGGARRPDVVVSVCEMPLVDGYQLCRLIKDQRALRHLPVLLLTADGMPLSGFWARTCGADRLLRRDADPAAVVRAAESLAARRGAPATDGPAVATPAPVTELHLEDVLRRLARAVESQLLESTLRAAVAGLYDGEHDPAKVADGFLGLVEELVLPGALLMTLPSEAGTVAHGLAGPGAGPEVRAALVARLVSGRHLAEGTAVTWRTVETGAAANAPTQGVITVGMPNEPPSGAVALALTREAAERYHAILGIALEELGRVLYLERAHFELLRLARRDALTGLMNRRTILERLEHELRRSRRFGQPLSVILFDVDHFKQVNDRHGHAAGDEVLRQVAARVSGRLRFVDAVGRFGGEEFLVVCPGTTAEGAAGLAEALRDLVAAEPMAGLEVTISLGVAGFEDGAETGDTLLARADARLYEAKLAGRDRVAV